MATRARVVQRLADSLSAESSAFELPAVRDARASTARVAVVGVALALHAFKFVPDRVSYMVWPYWAVTYRHGFVRRGLFGTLFQAAAEGLGVDRQRDIVLALHVAATIALGAGLVRWTLLLARDATPRTRALVYGAASAVALSHLFPTIASTTGYFDVYLLLLALGGAYLAWRGRALAAGLVTAVGPLVHDAFAFLWLPVVLCTIADVIAAPDRRPAARRAAPIAIPLVVEAAALAFHSRATFARVLEDLPPDWRGIEAFELSLRDCLRRMIDVVGHMPDQLALACLWYLPPAVVAAACAAAIGRGGARTWRRALFAAAVTLAPCSILLVAWDLSRFLVWSAFGAFVALAWCARRSDASSAGEIAPRGRVALDFAVGALALLAAGGPTTYTYFHASFADYYFGPRLLHRTPGALASTAFLRVYNRRLRTSSLHSRDGCRLFARGTARREPDCTFAVGEGGFVEAEWLTLAEGAYTATATVEPVEGCAEGRGAIAVHPHWRFAPETPPAHFDAGSGTASLDFTIGAEEEGFGRVALEVTREAGCFRLLSLDVVQR